MGKAVDTRFWDRIARKYAAEPISDMTGYERTLDRTRDLLQNASNVLELGCGTGTTTLRLAADLVRIKASDVSNEMIAIAREKAAAQDCHNVEFAVATAEQSSGPEGSFDAVLAFNLLHLLDDRASAFRHVHRLLKPGGLFISKTPCLSEMNPLIRLAVPVMRCIGKAPYVSFFDAAEIEAEVAGAGFAIVERARHGSKPKDARIFIAARKAGTVEQDGEGSRRDHLASLST